MSNFGRLITLFAALSLSIFSCDGKDKDEPVVPKDMAPELSTTSINASCDGGEFTFTVAAKGEWSAYSDEEWIKVKTMYDSDNWKSGTVVVTVDPNVDKYAGTINRSGRVSVKSGAASSTVAVEQAGMTADNTINAPEGYKLVWNDEFNDEDASGDWTFESKGPGWVNNELQTYVVRDPDCYSVSNGTLKITAKKDGSKIKSTRMYACASSGWQYGYVEARIKLPKGKGTWPAFWMMPTKFTSWPECGEIDIMEEVGYHPDYVSSSLHALGHYHANGTQVTKEVKCDGAEGDFHIYSMEWTHEYIQFFVDGTPTLYYANDGTGSRNWPYDQTFYVILNLAWGGDWGGSQGVDESSLPATMEVDYVRVFQKK
ncbi:MAG: family 16 glycosylhydrolase [Bacteroidales bacterium]|nr:family 16 glycosylhydrolase [Bacteroidales bacterium]